MERNLPMEVITIQLPAYDLFFIGQTLIEKNQTGQTIVFINTINKASEGIQSINNPLSVNLTVTQLLEIIELMGKESEFLYAAFNLSIEGKLMTQLAALAGTDLELAQYIGGRLSERKLRIDAYKTAFIEKYLNTQNIDLNV